MEDAVEVYHGGRHLQRWVHAKFMGRCLLAIALLLPMLPLAAHKGAAQGGKAKLLIT
jgi:hypothetical protein